MVRQGATWAFVRHYLEMVAAMMLGMLLHPLWRSVTDGLPAASPWRSVEVDSIAMATMMAVPMVAWMAVRRHGWGSTLEMAAAMYVAFVVLFPALWAGWIGEDGLSVLGHVLMFLLMLAVMLRRRHEFTHHSHRPGVAPAVLVGGGRTIGSVE